MTEAEEKMFTTIHPQKTYMEVAQRILDYIRHGDLKPGDCIPPEVKLAKMMGVSRSSVREALSALKLSGLIASRSGYGNYLCSVPETSSADTLSRLNELVKVNENPFAILEARECVETSIAYYAAERSTPEDLERIRLIIERMTDAECSAAQFLSLDSEFHITLAEAAHNDILLGVVKYLNGRMADSNWQYFKERNLYAYNRRSVTVKEHTAIYQAVVAHKPETARKQMLLHLEQTKDTVLSGILADNDTESLPQE